MYKIADAGDRPSVKSLWKAVFHDPNSFIDGFYDSFSDVICFIAVENDKAVAMVNAIPQSLVCNVRKKAAYIYAVATDENSRGQGYCRTLMKYAELQLRLLGFDCCILTPAEHTLFDFYSTLGYNTAFYKNNTGLQAGKEISVEHYFELRKKLIDIPYVEYDIEQLKFIERYYMAKFYETADGCFASAKDSALESLPLNMTDVPHSMIKWLTEPEKLENAYLGFPMD